MKQTKRKLSFILSAILLCALCVAPAHALEFTIDGPDDLNDPTQSEQIVVSCSD